MNDSPRLYGQFARNARPTFDWPRIAQPERVDENGAPADPIPRELSENRDRYIAQSAATQRDAFGRVRVAPLPPTCVSESQ